MSPIEPGAGASRHDASASDHATTGTTHDLRLPAPVGFALGGGGSLGAIQVGMLRALDTFGVRADLVAGTSIGAMNGAVVALDPVNAALRLEQIWRHMDRRTILPGGLFRRILTLLRSRTSVYDTKAIRELVHAELGDIDIEDLAIPYRALAVDADTTEIVSVHTGSLVTAMLASSAIPGVFPPVRRDGHDLYDGGLVTNTPVLDLLAMGAASVVVLDCQFPDRRLLRPRNIAETVLYTMTIAMRQQILRDLPVAAAQAPVVFLPGLAHAPISPLDFRNSSMLIDAAHQIAQDFLSTLAVNGPGLYHRQRPSS